MTPRHQERRRRALERLEARLHGKTPNEKQQQELESLRASLKLQPDIDAAAMRWAENERRRRAENERYNLA